MSPITLTLFAPGAAAGWTVAVLLRRLPAQDDDWEGGGPKSVNAVAAALLSGILSVLVCAVHGLTVDAALCCILAAILVGLSLYDFATGIIPPQLNYGILVLGALRAMLNLGDIASRIIGLAAVAVPLYLLFHFSDGRAIGGGDVKLMAACGLFLGWRLTVLAFFLGCIAGSVIHIARMKLSGASRTLAMGPYLSAGVIIAMLWGERLLAWYMGLF